MGTAGRFFTQLKLYLRAATIEFPSPGLFISVQNGAGGCFAKLNISDLQALIGFLMQCKDEIEPLWNAEVQKSASLNEQVIALQRQFANLYSLQQTLTGGDDDDDEEGASRP